jgi:hypothetical protein
MRLLSLVAFASLIVCTFAKPPTKKVQTKQVKLDTIIAEKKSETDQGDVRN